MRFSQIDRITQIVDGQNLTAVKSISMSEEYLEDHFPRFPVMPGVVMLESLFQASMWLVRLTNRFAYPMVAMRQAKNVRFRDLVEPGDQLLIETRLDRQEGDLAYLTASGSVNGRAAVSGKLVLERYWVRDRIGQAACQEQHMLNEFKRKFVLLLAPNIELSADLQRCLRLTETVPPAEKVN